MSKESKTNSSLSVSASTNQIYCRSEKLDQAQFAFDHIFNNNTQCEIFKKVLPIVNDALQGYNATIFTYGQTGSGKTFTMYGNGIGDDRGIVSRVVEDILKYVNENTNTKSFDITFSCLELYQEKLFDLLRSNTNDFVKPTPLRIRQHTCGGVWVEGLIEKKIDTLTEFNEKMIQVQKLRMTGSHNMNNESSRSHLCCIINIQYVVKATGERVKSKIHLIDLAGSEMVRKTGVNGARLNEAKYINKSLSALGNVINALTSNTTGSISDKLSTSDNVTNVTSNSTKVSSTGNHHIPYRDSKLTRLLEDSLSGNAKTLLILTISSDIMHIQETINTLRFGERAKKLKTIPKVNTEAGELSLQKALTRAEKQVIALNMTILELRNELSTRENEINILKKSLESVNNNNNEINSRSNICAKCNGSCTVIDDRKDEVQMVNKSKIPEETTNNKLQVDSKKPKKKSLSKALSSDRPSLDLDVGEDVTEEQFKMEGETRCAVCGLSEFETDSLFRDTGEHLGGYFTCDGNCGNHFHVRCAGEMGEGGQYIVPSGEWFCTVCTLEDDNEEMTMNTKQEHHSPEEKKLKDLSLSITEENVMNGDEYNVARLYAEYHAMRRERNRVLNQWQHDKRISKMTEDKRRERENIRDEELATATQRIIELEENLKREITENKRLKDINDDIVIRYRPSTSGLATPSIRKIHLSNNSGVESFAVDTAPSPVPSLPSLNQVLLEHKSKSNKKTDFSIGNVTPHMVSESLLQQTDINKASNSLDVESIPKPWVKSNKSNCVSSIGKGNSGRHQDDSASRRNDNLNNINLSPIRTRSQISDSSLTISVESSSKYGSKVSPTNHFPLNNSLPISMLSSDDFFPADNLLLNDSDDNSLNPTKSRLRSLLKSMREETGSFAEIRKKYNDREHERNALRSRHQRSSTSIS